MSRSHFPPAQTAGRHPSSGVPVDQTSQGWVAPPPGRAPRQLNQPAFPAPQAGVTPAGEVGAQDQSYPYAQPQAPYPYVPPNYDPYAQPQVAAGQPYTSQAYGAAGGFTGQPAEPGPYHGGGDPRGAGGENWPGPDRRALELATYTPAGAGHQSIAPDYVTGRHAQHHFTPPHTAGRDEWGGHSPFGAHGHDAGHEPMGYGGRGGDGAGFEQTYADDDGGYETAEPRRGRKMLSVLVSAIVIGGGLAYAYVGLLGSRSDTTPPVVKSADGPFKVKPSDPGGKQFEHTDSKIMGRLGEGGTASEPARTSADAGAMGADAGATGARKVPVVVVGRDGSIQSPAASEPSEVASPPVSVPGMTVVDGLGTSATRSGGTPTAAAGAAKPADSGEATKASEPQESVIVAPPTAPKKPVVIAKAVPSSSFPEASDAAPEPPANTEASGPAEKTPTAKTSATVATIAPGATPAPAATEPAAAPQTTGLGYVAVLASVPASANSRMEALKQFANMQEKYGTLLQDKTPDVKEANLGAKGTYHRLLVGPPGSRDAASALCLQLKAQGYNDCWVTAY